MSDSSVYNQNGLPAEVIQVDLSHIFLGHRAYLDMSLYDNENNGLGPFSQHIDFHELVTLVSYRVSEMYVGGVNPDRILGVLVFDLSSHILDTGGVFIDIRMDEPIVDLLLEIIGSLIESYNQLGGIYRLVSWNGITHGIGMLTGKLP